MATSDSVSLWVEGTFEEQTQELVNYLARGFADDARTAFIKPFQEALITKDGQKPIAEDESRRKKIIVMILGEVKGLGLGSERETEGFFNLLFFHVISLFSNPTEAQEQLAPLIHTISSSSTESPLLQYRVLSNLFNALPRSSPLRLQVYNALLALAVPHDDLSALRIERPTVKRWLAEWDVSTEDKSAFLKSLADAFDKTGASETSYDYLVLRLESLPSSTSEEAKSAAALDTIVSALRLPTVFDLNQLLKLEALQSVKEHPLFGLLRLLLHGDLAEYQKWQSENSSAVTEFGLDSSALDKKIRFLTLASLASKYVGKELPYADIASALQIEPSTVEVWVIDAIRAHLLAGRLSQPTQTFHVTRSITRAFTTSEWSQLEERLVGWRKGLVGVLEIVKHAREAQSERLGAASSSNAAAVSAGDRGTALHGDLAKEAPAVASA